MKYSNPKYHYFDLYNGYEAYKGKTIGEEKDFLIERKAPLYELHYSSKVINKKVRENVQKTKELYSILRKGACFGYFQTYPFRRDVKYLNDGTYEY